MVNNARKKLLRHPLVSVFFSGVCVCVLCAQSAPPSFSAIFIGCDVVVVVVVVGCGCVCVFCRFTLQTRDIIYALHMHTQATEWRL